MSTERPTTSDLTGQPDRAADAGAYDEVDDERQELLDRGDTQGFRARWEQIQTGFVDEPRRSVEDADTLVAELMQRLATTFADERRRLESQWDSGGDVSTEDLRVALQRYRSFFDRLLTV